MSHTDRIVVLIDMDCFYCQVEEKLDPALEGKPIAVVQYNAWRGGGIIAVNYPARDRGVTRHMRGDEAKKMCPEIILPKVPNVRGKADLTKYREAGQRVAEVLQTFTPLLERASIDEAYLDITDMVKKRLETNLSVTIDDIPNTHVVNYDVAVFLDNINTNSEYCYSNKKLAVGAMIVEEIRKEVLNKTGYKCSAGIAHNKILAKLVCGLHKPNKQTLLPQESVSILYKDLPIKKIKSLGGKFGNALAEELNISMMGELIQFSEKELIRKFDIKNGKWLYNIARGIDLDPVTTRLTSKSIGCCKRFPGNNCLRKQEHVEHWLSELATEISERLDKDLQENKRKAKQMVISFAQQEKNEMDRSSSRTISLNSYKQDRIARDSVEVIKKHCKKIDECYNITFLGISVGNFQEIDSNRSISSFFQNMNKTTSIKSATEKNICLPQSITNDSHAMFSDSCECIKERQNNDIDNHQTNCSFSETTSRDTLQKCDNVSDEDNDENLSIYSATTEELDEDPKSYIYYEDIFPDSSKIPSQDKSIISESTEMAKTRPASFFDKYFDSTSDESRTSISSVETGSNEKDSINVKYIFPEISEDEVDSSSKRINSHEKMSNKQECEECNKLINISEMTAHMDYHFALKLVRREAHLYNPPMPQKSKGSSDPKNDRGLKKNNKKGSISKFLQPIEGFTSSQAIQGIKRKTNDEKDDHSVILIETDGEFCNECNKKIESLDVISHEDYHLAKKLHAELNAPTNSHKKIPYRDKKKTDISTYFNRR